MCAALLIFCFEARNGADNLLLESSKVKFKSQIKRELLFQKTHNCRKFRWIPVATVNSAFCQKLLPFSLLIFRLFLVDIFSDKMIYHRRERTSPNRFYRDGFRNFERQINVLFRKIASFAKNNVFGRVVCWSAIQKNACSAAGNLLWRVQIFISVFLKPVAEFVTIYFGTKSVIVNSNCTIFYIFRYILNLYEGKPQLLPNWDYYKSR